MKLHESFSDSSGKVEHDLRRDISRGQLLPGERLCSESRLTDGRDAAYYRKFSVEEI